MIPNDIAYIVGKPGRYVLSSDPYVRTYLRVEVDEQGQLHQLKPDGVTRDGVLSRDGWVSPDVRAYIEGHDGESTTFTRVGLPPGAGVEIPLPKE